MLQIKNKQCLPKPERKKLKWPGYRELLNLDKKKTEKIESDDENQNYLEKLLKRQQEQKKLQEAQLKEELERLEKARKEEERKNRILRRYERKKMVEDGLLNKEDLSQSVESELELQHQVTTSVDEQEQLPPKPQVSIEATRPTTVLSRPMTNSTHTKRCKSELKVQSIQPYVISNAIYNTEKKVLPSLYGSFMKRLRTNSCQLIVKKNPTRKFSQNRLELLSQAKKPFDFIKNKDFYLDDFNEQIGTKTQRKPFDFNFISHPSHEIQQVKPHSSQIHRQSHNHLTVSQIFLRKMFVKQTDENLFIRELARRPR